MKILQIKFKNINSLKGEHLIDFEAEPLQSNALFAITGPTGSGKSTLLDVICLALFNQIPRMNKVSKSELSKTGAVITRHQKKAYAEVVYECKDGKFLSHWDIEYNRNENLNEYEMRIKDLISNEELDLKRSEVPAKNEALIGLNYPQFIKSILLAQGEFAKFLQAKDSERKQILEQITGTAIYRKLGMLAYEKAKVIHQEIALNKQRKADVEAKLWSQELFEEKQKHFEEKKQVKAKLTHTLNELKKQKEWVDEQQKLKLKYDENERKLNQSEDALKQFNEANATKIQKHLDTQAFAEELQDWKRQSQEKQSIALQIKQIDSDLDSLSKQKQQNLIEGSNLVGTELKASNYLESLEEFRQKIKILENKLKEIRNEYSIKLSPVRQDLTSLEIRADVHQLDEVENLLKQKASKINAELKTIDDLLEQHDDVTNKKTVEKLSNQIESAVEAKQLHQSIEVNQQRHKELTQQSKYVTSEIANLPNQLKKLANEQQLEKLELENLQLKKTQQLLSASLEKHRAQLKNGEACPLCGALEHPFLEDGPTLEDEYSGVIELKEKQLSKIIKFHQEAQQKLNQGEAKLESLQKQLDDAMQDLSKNQQVWESKFEMLAKQKGQLNWDGFIEKLKQIRTALENKTKLENQLSLVNILFEKVSDLKNLSSKGKKLKTELSNFYTGKAIDEDVNALKSAWDKLVENIRLKKETQLKIKSDLQALTENLNQLSKTLLLQIKEKGFSSIEEAAASRIKELDFQQLQNKSTALAKSKQQAEIDLKHIQQTITELTAKIKLDDRSQLLEEIQKKEYTLQETEKLVLEFSRAIENQKEFRNEIKALQKNIENTRKENGNWLLMNELIGDKTGKKFNDFAQDLSLQHLLNMANKRLLKLTDRYQLDRPNQEEGSDLVAVDFHMGNERRSVKTLSGGETFVVSLALALALSDLASKNVSINSMFIDEGFGTLDPETLDQTLDTLERLQAESNKTIGIISHVEALKERIQTQIKLSKNGQGYSSLQVV